MPVFRVSEASGQVRAVARLCPVLLPGWDVFVPRNLSGADPS